MDVDSLRKQFPALVARRGIYFDNAATSLTPYSVLSEVARYSHYFNVNVGRSAYELAARLTFEVEEVRERLARFIGAQPDEIAFTANATDALNKLALSFPFKENERITITALEHHSNILPWRLAARRHGLGVGVIPLTAEGVVDIESSYRLLGGECWLVAFSGASNVLGTVQPVKELTELAHAEGALAVLDAAQWVGHRPINVKEIGCDALAFSAHKMCGPTGVGALYVRKEIQDLLCPAILGGGTVKDVTDGEIKLKDFPASFEAGTPNISGILGFGKAVEFLEEVGLREIENRITYLHQRLYTELRGKKEVELYTPSSSENVGIISFNIRGLSPHQTASLYDHKAGIMVRSGFHCASPLVRTLGEGNGTVRVSLAFYNTEEEIDRFLDVTDEIVAQK